MAFVTTTSALSRASLESTLTAASPVKPLLEFAALKEAVGLLLNDGTAAFGPGASGLTGEDDLDKLHLQDRWTGSSGDVVTDSHRGYLVAVY